MKFGSTLFVIFGALVWDSFLGFPFFSFLGVSWLMIQTISRFRLLVLVCLVGLIEILFGISIWLTLVCGLGHFGLQSIGVTKLIQGKAQKWLILLVWVLLLVSSWWLRDLGFK